MIPTHVFSFNGTLQVELQPRDGTVEDRLTQMLARLDGVERYSLQLWRLPDGQRLVDVDMETALQEYLQTAGDFNGRLTAELRELVDGSERQYVIGRSGGGEDGADELVPWNGHEARVRGNEVLSGEEVSRLFISYLHDGTLPDGYSRRTIEI